jgi:hypothetical protein
MKLTLRRAKSEPAFPSPSTRRDRFIEQCELLMRLADVMIKEYEDEADDVLGQRTWYWANDINQELPQRW